MYSSEPSDKMGYTNANDEFYAQIAVFYDLFVKRLPVWRHWICHAIPFISGPRVLEISYGTGYLLTKFANRFSTYGIDYNWEMARTAKHNLLHSNCTAAIQQANVQNLPYQSEVFDSVVNTMAFSGYPDGRKALAEIRRVLRPGGRLVLVDINYPHDGNILGVKLVQGWIKLGDIIRDMESLLNEYEMQFTETEVGGFGSVHLYVATKKQISEDL